MQPMPYIRRAIAAGAAAAFLAAGAADSVSPASASRLASLVSPKQLIAVHDFGEEHAHLADSVYDRMNPLILAALPRGKPAIVFRAPTKCVPGSLIKVLKRVSAKYGPITVNSTWRPRSQKPQASAEGQSPCTCPAALWISACTAPRAA